MSSPNAPIVNPLPFVIPFLFVIPIPFVIPECIYRESTVTVIPEITPTVILEILYQELKVIVIPNLIGDPGFSFLHIFSFLKSFIRNKKYMSSPT
jgi:hypothetical protein